MPSPDEQNLEETMSLPPGSFDTDSELAAIQNVMALLEQSPPMPEQERREQLAQIRQRASRVRDALIEEGARLRAQQAALEARSEELTTRMVFAQAELAAARAAADEAHERRLTLLRGLRGVLWSTPAMSILWGPWALVIILCHYLKVIWGDLA
jgi:chromosome segregation ATPase